MMRSRFVLVCLSCVAAAGEPSPAPALADPAALALRLVKAMNVGEMSAMGLRRVTTTMRSQGMTEQEAECVRAVTAADYEPVLAQVAAAELTAAEMEEAIRFYESPAGRKYTVMTEVKTAEAMRIRTEKTLPDFTRKEVSATERFGKTPVFQKLVNENLLTRSATGRRLTQEATLAILQRCKSAG